MNIKDATDALNALSTASDTLSLKVDKLVTDVGAVLTLVKDGPALTPEQEAAVNKAKVTLAAVIEDQGQVDAAIAAADEVLPQPAPPGEPPVEDPPAPPTEEEPTTT